jgi:hypothetical protein
MYGIMVPYPRCKTQNVWIGNSLSKGTMTPPLLFNHLANYYTVW